MKLGWSQVLRNNPKLREAYDAVLTITVESQEKTFYQAFEEAAARGEIPEKLESDQVSADSQINHDQKNSKIRKVNIFPIKCLYS